MHWEVGFAGQGTAFIEQSLRWARSASTSAKLFYNDYGAEVVTTKSDAILAMATDFKNRGVSLDGIGFQMHVDLSFDNSARLQSLADNLQRFAALGLELHITELDIRVASNDATTLNQLGALSARLWLRAFNYHPASWCRPGVSRTSTRGFQASSRDTDGRCHLTTPIRRSPLIRGFITR